MGQRRKAREYALQGIYMNEVGKAEPEEIVDFSWVDRKVSQKIKDFSTKLILGTLENRDQIDSIIKKHSKNWSPERLSSVDRSILRLAIFEILYMDDIPDVVTIDESIELGKTFGGETSAQFINGILDSVKKTES